MKKTLLLAMSIFLSSTVFAYAGNPFSDVPMGHWSYDAVNKLASAGIVNGYGDDTFGGDRLMTRYEMAQIVAKAMAKGTNVDRLAAEFAGELDSLGVRVAALEKKSDNVTFVGEIHNLYTDRNGKNKGEKTHGIQAQLRTRLWLTGQVNDEWSYTGMVQNIQTFHTTERKEEIDFQRAYVQGKVGEVDVLLGRYSMWLGNGHILDACTDGVELNYGKKIKTKVVFGKAADNGQNLGNRYAGGEVTAALKDVNLVGGYYNFRSMHSGDDFEFRGMRGYGAGLNESIWLVGADYTIGDLILNGMYLRGDANIHGKDVQGGEDGWTVGFSYKAADVAVPGSYGVFFNYFDQGAQTYLAQHTDGNSFVGQGFRGGGGGVDYMLAKNILFRLAYYDTKSKTFSNTKEKVLWTAMNITF